MANVPERVSLVSLTAPVIGEATSGFAGYKTQRKYSNDPIVLILISCILSTPAYRIAFVFLLNTGPVAYSDSWL